MLFPKVGKVIVYTSHNNIIVVLTLKTDGNSNLARRRDLSRGIISVKFLIKLSHSDNKVNVRL